MESKFSSGSTLLHTVDPRIKIITFLLFGISAALSSSATFLFAVGIFVLILIGILKENPITLLKSVAFAEFFLIFIIITMAFSYSSDTYIKVFFFKIYPEGLKYGLFLFFKSNILLLLMVLLLSTSTIFEIAHALHHLKFPKKLVQILFFTFRYIHTIKEEYNKLLKAAIVRGFKPKTNIHTYRTYSYLLSNLLIRSYLKADRIYKAMLCRGFKGEFPVYKHFKASKKDYYFLIISLTYLIFAIYWSGIWKF